MSNQNKYTPIEVGQLSGDEIATLNHLIASGEDFEFHSMTTKGADSGLPYDVRGFSLVFGRDSFWAATPKILFSQINKFLGATKLAIEA